MLKFAIALSLFSTLSIYAQDEVIQGQLPQVVQENSDILKMAMTKGIASEFRNQQFEDMLDAKDLMAKIEFATKYVMSFDFQLLEEKNLIVEARLDALKELNIRISKLKNKDMVALALALHNINSLQVENRERMQLKAESMLDIIVQGLKEGKLIRGRLTELGSEALKEDDKLIELLQTRFQALPELAVSPKLEGGYGHEIALSMVKQAIQTKEILGLFEEEAKLSPNFISTLKFKHSLRKYNDYQDVKELILKELTK